jgi:hypothetical protein
MNFQISTKNQKARDAIYELFAAKERGEFVTHDSIEKASKLTRANPKDAYHTIMDQVKKRHRDNRGITISSEIGVGYSLATAEQQLWEVKRRTKKAKRQIVRGTKDTGSLPDEHATDHQIKIRDALVEEGQRLARESQDSARLEDFLMRRKPGEPLKIRMRDDEEQAEAV